MDFDLNQKCQAGLSYEIERHELKARGDITIDSVDSFLIRTSISTESQPACISVEHKLQRDPVWKR